VNYPNFGMPNYQMPVSGAKYGGMGQNAMVAPGAYSPDPNTVSSGGSMGYGGGNPGFAFGGMSPQYMMGQYGGYPQQQPLMRNRGMRPFRGQNAMNSMYGQMPSPYASVE